MFEAAFQQSPIPTTIASLATDRLVEINEAACQMLGMVREAVLGLTSEEAGLIMAAEDRAEATRRLLHDGHLKDFRARYRRNGRAGWQSLSASLIEVEGEPCVMASFEDITDKLDAEERLRESELRYRSLVEQTADGVLVIDEEAHVIEMNPAMAELIGRSPEEVRGTLWTSYIEPANLADLPFIDVNREAANGLVFERRVVRPDGSIVELEFHARRQEKGLMLGTARDIGWRKAADRERARLIQAIESSSDAILIGDFESGMVAYINPAMERRLGLTREWAVGRRYADVLEEYREPERFADAIAAVRRDGRWSGEIVGRDENGHVRREWVSVSILRDEAARLASFVLVRRDTTRETELEEQLRQAQKMEAVGRLAGGVAHDFNNLLTAILGFTELARGQAEPGTEIEGHLAEIRAAAERATHLTRQLLAFGRRAAIDPEVLDLNAVCAAIQPMLQRIIGEDVQLELACDPDLRRVKADRGYIEQVIVNLAANARDAMPGGGNLTICTANVKLEPTQAALGDAAAPRDNVRLAVRDTGVGMSPEMLAVIWEPFYTTKSLGNGVGLGLATVDGIVKQIGGHIHVESEPGRGSTFMVDLPAVDGDLVAAPPVLAAEQPRGMETLLVVEDDAQVLGVVLRFLERSGYHVLSATNGPRAIEIAEAHDGPIHLLLSDMVMPGMNGEQVAEEVRARRPGIKVVLCSGYSEDARRWSTADGHYDFVAKPYSMDALLGGVRRALDRPRQTPGPEDAGQGPDGSSD